MLGGKMPVGCILVHLRSFLGRAGHNCSRKLLLGHVNSTNAAHC